jgi:uncharacterized protein (DUF2141 family)
MATVTLRVQQVRSEQGDLVGGIYIAQDFKRFGGAAAAHSALGDAADCMLVFQDVGPGRYAAAVYHDENGNGKLDLTMFGTPSEGRGYTMTPTVRLAPPSFEEAAFDVGSDDVDLAIHLRYPG